MHQDLIIVIVFISTLCYLSLVLAYWKDLRYVFPLWIIAPIFIFPPLFPFLVAYMILWVGVASQGPPAIVVSSATRGRVHVISRQRIHPRQEIRFGAKTLDGRRVKPKNPR